MSYERPIFRQFGDTIIASGYDRGRWIFAAGPAFPDGDMPVPHPGAVFFRTDLGAHYLYDDSGTWTVIGNAVFSGLSKLTVGPTEPESPSEGDLWVDTT